MRQHSSRVTLNRRSPQRPTRILSQGGNAEATVRHSCRSSPKSTTLAPHRAAWITDMMAMGSDV
eukprot:7530924-Pyramimonas_sp.AAC.1